MGPVEQLKQEMLQALDGRLTGCTLTGEFPLGFASPDPKNLVVVVGIRALHLKEGALGEYLGESQAGSPSLSQGRWADVTLEFTLLHPNRSGNSLQQAADQLMDLLLTDTPYPIRQINQEVLTFDRTMGCVRMSVTAKMDLLFCKEKSHLPVEGFELVRVSSPTGGQTGKENQ